MAMLSPDNIQVALDSSGAVRMQGGGKLLIFFKMFSHINIKDFQENMQAVCFGLSLQCVCSHVLPRERISAEDEFSQLQMSKEGYGRVSVYNAQEAECDAESRLWKSHSGCAIVQCSAVKLSSDQDVPVWLPRYFR